MPRYVIDIADEQDSWPIDEGRLREVVARTLEFERVAKAEVSIAIVDDPTIHALNRRHLAHDYPTDVLSFLLERVAGRESGERRESSVEEMDAAAQALEASAPTLAVGALGESRPSSFDSQSSTPAPQSPAFVYLEGEIIVSADTATRQAAGFGWSPGDELVLYVVHGLLHLTGYDDGTEAEQDRMRSREREILRTWGLSPSYGDPGENPPREDDVTQGDDT